MTEMTVQQWRAIRKEAGLKLNPEIAEVVWEFVDMTDPYGVRAADLPEGVDPDPPECIGRVYFARAPGSDMWIGFFDLPDSTIEWLMQRLPDAQIESDWDAL